MYIYATMCPQGKQFLQNRGLLSFTEIILSTSFDIDVSIVHLTP